MESSSQRSHKRKSLEETKVPRKLAKRSLTPLIMDEIIEEIEDNEECLTPPLPAVIDSDEIIDLIDMPTPPEKTGPKTPEEGADDKVEKTGPKTPEGGADDKVEKTGPKTPEEEADDDLLEDELTLSEEDGEFSDD